MHILSFADCDHPLYHYLRKKVLIDQVLIIQKAYNEKDNAEARVSIEMMPDSKHLIYSIYGKKQHIWDLNELGLTMFSSPSTVFIPFKLMITK